MRKIDLDKNKPLVSITVPVYSSKYLAGTLNSLVTQTYNDIIEIIVVNDGGDDGIDKTMDAFSFFRNLRYIRKPNGGTGSAINSGHNISRGELLTWCSADNIYFPEYVQCFVEAFKEIDGRDTPESIDFIYSDFCYIDNSGRVLKNVIHERPQQGKDLVDGYDIGMSFMYRRSLWDKAGPYWGRICEDFEFAVRAAQHTHFGLIKNVLAAFRAHGDQITGSNKTKEVAAADDCKALARSLFLNDKSINLDSEKYKRAPTSNIEVVW